MHCRVVCGDEVWYDGEARIAVARSPDGEFAVMDGHEPMLAALAPGPLRIQDERGTHTINLLTGLLHVAGDNVTVVASGRDSDDAAERGDPPPDERPAQEGPS